jgi:hypothetical protein
MFCGYLIASRRPPGRAVWQWSLDVWMVDRQTDRQTDRQPDSNSTPNSPKSTPTSTPTRPTIDPQSTPNRPSWPLAPARGARRVKTRVTQWWRSFFYVLDRFGVNLGPLWISTWGPKSSPKRLRRDLFGLLRFSKRPCLSISNLT